MSFQCYIILKLSNTVISIVEKLMKRTASVFHKVNSLKKTEGNEQIHLKSPFIKCKIKLIKSWSNLPSLYIYINSVNARAMLTSVCSSGWGDCGGVITCSLHISSVMPSSNGGGNGMLASGGTSTSNCAKNKGLPLNLFSLILEK